MGASGIVATFRALVVFAILLHLLLWLVPLAPRLWPELQTPWLLQFDGYGATLDPEPVLYWCLLAAWLLVLIGLFFFVSGARAGFVVLLLGSVVLDFAWGIRVLVPYEAALATLVAVIDGTVIAMAYWSSVHREFGRRR